ncbi:MAG: dienelactone hydrolase family protein [Pseudonocardiaceae bacterium]|nr:dienelactone hydrolase family protein [Pseudonocardiaceae bacterium]
MQLQLDVADAPIPAYLAVPAEPVSGAGPWPGVVVVHDAFGLSDDIRSITERFATAGYLALAPDLYGRGGALRCVRAVFTAMRAGSGQAVDDLQAARRLLLDRTDCTGTVGIAGFCMGGGFALVMAPRGYDASAPYYGEMPADEGVLDGACPVVASFGRRDPALRGAADRLRGALDSRGVPHDVKEYPDAGHSFANRLPFGPPAPLRRIVGLGYHHESSEDAWRRVFAFFGEHLRTG